MKQALRVAFGFLMLWAAVLHAEVRIEITQGVDSARPIALCLLNGPGRALRLKISAASWRQIYAIAVNLIR